MWQRDGIERRNCCYRGRNTQPQSTCGKGEEEIRRSVKRSVGCILAELIKGSPLLPGENYLNQLQMMINLLGTPSKEDMMFIQSEQSKDFINQMPKRQKINLKEFFPSSNPLAIDLLSKLLVFNPVSGKVEEAEA